MSRKYLISNIGIGDLIFFCCSILLNHEIGETIEIKISKNSLKVYRENSVNYEIFCKNYIEYFLSNYEIKFLTEGEANYHWELDPDTYARTFQNDFVVKTIKDKLNLKNDNYNDCIVVFTKIRDLHSSLFSTISEEFFKSINESGKKIILLGEKEIKYGNEYSRHGEEKIYSIYDQCINNIDNDKIIDLTINIYEFNDFSLDSIINDINIIFNSSTTYVFGGGGFFCLSLFTGKLTSLTNSNNKSWFYSDYNQNIFSELNEFTEHLNK
jgi:hypothetical protein